MFQNILRRVSIRKDSIARLCSLDSSTVWVLEYIWWTLCQFVYQIMCFSIIWYQDIIGGFFFHFLYQFISIHTFGVPANGSQEGVFFFAFFFGVFLNAFNNLRFSIWAVLIIFQEFDFFFLWRFFEGVAKWRFQFELFFSFSAVSVFFLAFFFFIVLSFFGLF